MNQESPSSPLDPSFVRNVTDTKYKLYQTIVFQPELDSNTSQDNAILNKYLQQLNHLHQLSIRAQEGVPVKRLERHLAAFPMELQEPIRALLEWIRAYFQANRPIKTTPYSHYLESSFRTYPFMHRPSLRANNANDVVMEDPMNTL